MVDFLSLLQRWLLLCHLNSGTMSLRQPQEVPPPAAAREELRTPAGGLRRSGGSPNVALWGLKGLNGQLEPPAVAVMVDHRAPGRVPTQPITRMHPCNPATLQMSGSPLSTHFFFLFLGMWGGCFVYTAIAGFDSGDTCKAAAGGGNQETQSFTHNKDLYWKKKCKFRFLLFLCFIFTDYFSASVLISFPSFFTPSKVIQARLDERKFYFFSTCVCLCDPVIMLSDVSLHFPPFFVFPNLCLCSSVPCLHQSRSPPVPHLTSLPSTRDTLTCQICNTATYQTILAQSEQWLCRRNSFICNKAMQHPGLSTPSGGCLSYCSFKTGSLSLLLTPG